MDRGIFRRPAARVQHCTAPASKGTLHELDWHSTSIPLYPLRDLRLNAEFVPPDSGEWLLVPGFFDGEGAGGQSGRNWRIRFMPTKLGRWRWRTTVAPVRTGLGGHSGEFTATLLGVVNHGPILRSGPPSSNRPLPTSLRGLSVGRRS